MPLEQDAKISARASMSNDATFALDCVTVSIYVILREDDKRWQEVMDLIADADNDARLGQIIREAAMEYAEGYIYDSLNV